MERRDREEEEGDATKRKGRMSGFYKNIEAMSKDANVEKDKEKERRRKKKEKRKKEDARASAEGGLRDSSNGRPARPGTAGKGRKSTAASSAMGSADEYPESRGSVEYPYR